MIILFFVHVCELAIFVSYERHLVSRPAYFKPNEKFSFYHPNMLPTMSTSNSTIHHPLPRIVESGSDMRRLTISDILCKSKKTLKTSLLGIPEGISYQPHLADVVYMFYVLNILIASPSLLYRFISPLLSDPIIPLQSPSHDDPSCARSINVCHEKLGW